MRLQLLDFGMKKIGNEEVSHIAVVAVMVVVVADDEEQKQQIVRVCQYDKALYLDQIFAEMVIENLKKINYLATFKREKGKRKEEKEGDNYPNFVLPFYCYI